MKIGQKSDRGRKRIKVKTFGWSEEAPPSIFEEPVSGFVRDRAGVDQVKSLQGVIFRDGWKPVKKFFPRSWTKTNVLNLVVFVTEFFLSCYEFGGVN